MGKFFDHTKSLNSLKTAWSRVRQNGLASSLPETRSQIAHFEQDADRNLRGIQTRLRKDEFEFDPQKGILKQKANGKVRGIVMASVHNRIVERALLDCLQDKCAYVKQVLEELTSVGGVPHRSVPHGLALIKEAFKNGKSWFVRSDISGFFDNVPRKDVLTSLSQHVEDQRFLLLLDRATQVILGNEKFLGENRKCFPTDELGLAQGSPLSPLLGNILLQDFDRNFNDRGIVCVRFIDDFVLLGDTEAKVQKAFSSAQAHLLKLSLHCHNPYKAGADTKKAECGPVSSGFDFLGYRIVPGLYQPSAKARQKVLASVDKHIRMGRRGITDCIREANSFANRQRYAQTHDFIDRMLKGWGNAFAYSNSKSTMVDLDRKIDEKLDSFRKWFSGHVKLLDQAQKRRAGGVCLLADVKPKSLDQLPFAVTGKRQRFRQSSRTITISTDGSVLTSGKRLGRDTGPGGWAFVVHETGETASGSKEGATNNEMELLGVLETLRRLPHDKSIKIRTDSQYVARTFNDGQIVTSHFEMWNELIEMARDRAIKIIWIKGHAGDEQNTLADKLAKEAAARLEQLSPKPAKQAA